MKRVFSENYWETGACYGLAAVVRCHCGPLGGGTGCGGSGPAPEQVHRQHDSAQKCQWKNGTSRVSSHLYTSCKSSTQWLEATRSQVTTTWVHISRFKMENVNLSWHNYSYKPSVDQTRLANILKIKPKHWFSQSKKEKRFEGINFGSRSLWWACLNYTLQCCSQCSRRSLSLLGAGLLHF